MPGHVVRRGSFVCQGWRKSGQDDHLVAVPNSLAAADYQLLAAPHTTHTERAGRGQGEESRVKLLGLAPV